VVTWRDREEFYCEECGALEKHECSCRPTHLRLVPVDNVDNVRHTVPMTTIHPAIDKDHGLVHGDHVIVRLSPHCVFEGWFDGGEDVRRTKRGRNDFIRMARVFRVGSDSPELVFFPTVSKGS
jgi:hypothetical protein